MDWRYRTKPVDNNAHLVIVEALINKQNQGSYPVFRSSLSAIYANRGPGTTIFQHFTVLFLDGTHFLKLDGQRRCHLRRTTFPPLGPVHLLFLCSPFDEFKEVLTLPWFLWREKRVVAMEISPPIKPKGIVH